MDIIMVPVADIQPNDYNPNVVPEKIMEHLHRNIEKEGIKAPLIIRPPDRAAPEEKDLKIPYIIVDGEHRWLNAKDLGAEKVPCEIRKDMTRKEAMVETITMNKLRGEFDQLKLADVIATLKKAYTPEELEEKLGYTQIELQDFDDLVDIDYGALRDISADEMSKIDSQNDGSETMLNEFTISCSLRQLEIIEAAIAENASDDNDKAWSLEMVCTEHLNNHAPEKIGEIEKRLKQLATKTVVQADIAQAIDKEEGEALKEQSEEEVK